MLIITALVVLFILIVSVTIIFIKWHKMEKDFKEWINEWNTAYNRFRGSADE